MPQDDTSDLSFHHVGCLTHSLESSCEQYLGIYGDGAQSPIYKIECQKVRVCFVGPPQGPCVEFVQPIDETSTLAAMLRKRIQFYHLAYYCNSLSIWADRLESRGWRIVNTFSSEAFGGATCGFFLSSDGQLLELIERQ